MLHADPETMPNFAVEVIVGENGFLSKLKYLRKIEGIVLHSSNWSLSAVGDRKSQCKEGKVQFFHDLQLFTSTCSWCMQVPNP